MRATLVESRSISLESGARSGHAMPWSRSLPWRFRTTRWTIVARATAKERPPQDALGELYRDYYHPVYGLIASKRGHAAAAELTQAFFFKRWVNGKDLKAFRREKCTRFRNWIRAAVESFLKTEAQFWRRQCRNIELTSTLDVEDAHQQFLADPTTDPERRFDRAWTIDLLRKVIAQLREEYIANVSSRERPQAPDRFDSIKIYLPGPEMDLPKYKEVAVGLGMTPDAIKQLVDRQRRRFAELLRERVREHVESADEVESEIRFLYGALAAPIPRSW